MRSPFFGRLVGIQKVPKEKKMSLTLAMLTLSAQMRAQDSFCIKEIHWAHGVNGKSKPEKATFQISLFRDSSIPVQMEGTNLSDTLDKALAAYKLAVG